MTDIVILTGAGISAESGLGTFRDQDGLWTKYDLDEVSTPEGFARNPALVLEFYNAHRKNCRTANPNSAHNALARLAHEFRGNVQIITQNVDDLHERAGSKAVWHMHGQLSRALCNTCCHRWEAPDIMAPTDACPACKAHATRPDIVWFGEIPYLMDEIYQTVADTDLFVSIGTSGSVYPAAGLVEIANDAGAWTLELNLEPSETVTAFAESRTGEAGKLVPAWVDEILAMKPA